MLLLKAPAAYRDCGCKHCLQLRTGRQRKMRTERGKAMAQTSSARKELDLGLTEMKRNPYLVDYEEYRRKVNHTAKNHTAKDRLRASQVKNRDIFDQDQIMDMGTARKQRQSAARSIQGERVSSRQSQTRSMQGERVSGRQSQTRSVRDEVVRRQSAARPMQSEAARSNGAVRQVRTTAVPAYKQSNRTAYAQSRRRREQARLQRARMQRRIILLGGIACILVFAAILYLRNQQPPQVDGSVAPKIEPVVNFLNDLTGEKVQGISAYDFAKHPTWEENFLTPNEYSRPGDPLTEVKNIFVHYTANPGTSAAQNRSYFESLKDTHETSASAHFIIGYNGEIIQCIPLDEIGYAVQTRNEDSISIECCFLEADGSFTKETYDSLISLLKWLTDVYDLDAEDILRHYDCGGKKCPLYYTENPEEWEQLKQDVKNL